MSAWASAHTLEFLTPLPWHPGLPSKTQYCTGYLGRVPRELATQAAHTHTQDLIWGDWPFKL